MKKTDLGVVGVVYAICALFLYLTLQLPKSAQTYPLFILAILFILTSMYLVKMLVGYKKVGIVSHSGEFEGVQPKQFFVILGLVFLYVIMLNYLGFYLSTVLFMVATLRYLKVPYLTTVIAVAVICLIVYLAFSRFLGVRLPEMRLF